MSSRRWAVGETELSDDCACAPVARVSGRSQPRNVERSRRLDQGAPGLFGKSCASTKLRCEVEMIMMITNRALIILVLCFLLCRTGRCDAKAP